MPQDAPRKDVWERLTALATILVPAAIALAGHFVAQGLKQAEIASDERQATESRSIDAANTKIAQASFLNTMMKSLTSADPKERQLAVEAVLIALPEQGPVLVRTIAKTDQDTGVQVAASDSLNERADMLIREMFSDDAVVRVRAAGDLIQGWRADPTVVPTLLDFASRNPSNTNGIYNSVVVLTELSPRALEPNKAAVLAFAEAAKATGSKTAVRADILVERIKSGPGMRH